MVSNIQTPFPLRLDIIRTILTPRKPTHNVGYGPDQHCGFGDVKLFECAEYTWADAQQRWADGLWIKQEDVSAIKQKYLLAIYRFQCGTLVQAVIDLETLRAGHQFYLVDGKAQRAILQSKYNGPLAWYIPLYVWTDKIQAGALKELNRKNAITPIEPIVRMCRKLARLIRV